MKKSYKRTSISCLTHMRQKSICTLLLYIECTPFFCVSPFLCVTHSSVCGTSLCGGTSRNSSVLERAIVAAECVAKVVNKSEDENYSQDNFCLESAPKYLGSWRLRHVWCNSWEAEIKIADVGNFDPITSESRKWLNEELQRNTCKRITRTTVWVRRPRRKFMKQAIASLIRQNSSNSLHMPT